MVIDHHFGFIAFSWAIGILGFVGLAVWIWRDRRALDRQLAELEDPASGVVPRRNNS
ncbi:MAG: heme exporter protein CcmD [Pseudomonadota bacterium]